MIIARIIINYLIFHLLCALYIYWIFDQADYEPDKLDHFIVFALAPIIVIHMWISNIKL